MKNKIIVFLLVLFSLPVFAQEQQKSNSDVELPDFVITGKDIVTLRKVQKIPPDFIPAISEEFLKPVFPVEKLQMKEVTTPVKGLSGLIDTLNYLNGNLDVSLGAYYFPKADVNFSSTFKNGLFNALGNFENTKAYVPNSEKSLLNGGASLSLFTNDDADFLPGTEFKFNGNYGVSSYKFFASNNPLLGRTLNNGNAYFKIENLISKYFIFSGKLSDNITSLKDENFSENMFNVDGFAQLALSAFNLGINLNYKKQILKNDVNPNSRFSFIGIRPTMGLDFSKLTKLSFGFNYQHSGSDNFFSPYAAIGININQNVSLYGEYSSQAEFFGGEHFLKLNPYFMPQKFSNIFFEKKNALSAFIKYEFYTFIEIDGGFRYYSSDNLPYFSDTTNPGMFDLQTTNGKSFTVFANFLFHPGPGGVFYATAELNDTRNSANNMVPYYPRAKVTLNYGYDFDFGLNANANLEYLSGMYVDIQNQNSLNSYINLGLKFGYKIKSNFYLTLTISNLLNHNNYLWQGYKELPIDFEAGLNYKW